MSRGRLVVLSGPSGVGKTTVGQALLARIPGLVRSVSATTRPPRPGEREGVDYHFTDPAGFAAMDFLEQAEVHGRRYGTPRAPVERSLAEGRDVLLVIDVQGARQVRSKVPGALLVFLEPPSWEELVRRLTGRGTESPEALERRLSDARKELAEAPRYDHRIVNDDLAGTVRAVQEILDRGRSSAL